MFSLMCIGMVVCERFNVDSKMHVLNTKYFLYNNKYTYDDIYIYIHIRA